MKVFSREKLEGSSLKTTQHGIWDMQAMRWPKFPPKSFLELQNTPLRTWL